MFEKPNTEIYLKQNTVKRESMSHQHVTAQAESGGYGSHKIHGRKIQSLNVAHAAVPQRKSRIGTKHSLPLVHTRKRKEIAVKGDRKVPLRGVGECPIPIPV